MPETTPLIKAALNLRVGAGFDVYKDNMIGLGTIEKEQNTNHTQVSQTCISKTNLIFFYGRCKWCIMLNFAGPIGDCCIILEPKLDE